MKHYQQPVTHVTAPYNFVPLAKAIMCPRWAPHISHDLPFRDGLSGSLDIEIKAETDIFVGGSGNNASGIREFHRGSDRKPAIPGSSVRGMLRNTMEILSFGRMIRIDDRRFGLRDMYNERYKSLVKSVKAGWLCFKDSRYVIYPCAYFKVRHEHIPGYAAIANVGSIKEKYKKLTKKGGKPGIDFELPCYAFDAGAEKSRDNVVYVKNLEGGENSGTLILTGNMPKKTSEFIFCSPEKISEPVALHPGVMARFRQIYADQERPDATPWAFWEPMLRTSTGVPVFYLEDQGGDITHFGLSRLIKIPADNSTRDAVSHTSPEHINEGLPDLADCIFGRTTDDYSLKGRVSIGTADCTATTGETSMTRYILNAPKASYDVAYLEQPPLGSRLARNTYNTPDVITRGWKRYPLHKQTQKPDNVDVKNNKILSSIKGLKAGTKFKSTIRFHNLRPAELGALVWALTWGSNTGTSRYQHSLGGVKSFGFGRVSIKIMDHKLTPNDPMLDDGSASIQACLDAYEKIMNDFIKVSTECSSWKETPQFVQLLAMSDSSNMKPSSELSHLGDVTLYVQTKKLDANRDVFRLKPHANAAPIHWKAEGAIIVEHP